MLLPSRSNLCPSCGGCLPDEGPPSLVCRCGSDWGDPLRELIRLLDELLSDPETPDQKEAAMPAIADDLLTDSPQVAMIRKHAADRDLVIVTCAETSREWLIDRKEKDTEQALVAEVLCPRSEPLQGLVRDEVPDLLAEIDRLRAALATALRGEG